MPHRKNKGKRHLTDKNHAAAGTVTAAPEKKTQYYEYDDEEDLPGNEDRDTSPTRHPRIRTPKPSD